MFWNKKWVLITYKYTKEGQEKEGFNFFRYKGDIGKAVANFYKEKSKKSIGLIITSITKL